MAIAELETSPRVLEKPKPWERTIIDFTSRTVYVQKDQDGPEREIVFKGSADYWVFTAVADTETSVRGEELDGVAKENWSTKSHPTGACIYKLRRIFEDNDKSFIISDPIKGSKDHTYSLNSKEIIYVGYRPREIMWNRMADSWEAVDVQEGKYGHLSINGSRPIYFQGRQRELVMATPSTGRDLLDSADLSWIIFGTPNRVNDLHPFLYQTNTRKLRPAAKVEICYMWGLDENGNMVSGYGFRKLVELDAEVSGENHRSRVYYHRGLVNEAPPVREKPKWKVSKIDKHYLKLFENFTKWGLYTNPHWPTLLRDGITSRRMHRLALNGKFVNEAYTIKELSGILVRIYNKLAADVDNIDRWPEFKKNQWKKIQDFKERKKATTDEALVTQIRMVLTKSLTDYKKTLAQKNSY